LTILLIRNHVQRLIAGAHLGDRRCSVTGWTAPEPMGSCDSIFAVEAALFFGIRMMAKTPA
jgi:hypothetical protein